MDHQPQKWWSWRSSYRCALVWKQAPEYSSHCHLLWVCYNTYELQSTASQRFRLKFLAQKMCACFFLRFYQDSICCFYFFIIPDHIPRSITIMTVIQMSCLVEMSYLVAPCCCISVWCLQMPCGSVPNGLSCAMTTYPYQPAARVASQCQCCLSIIFLDFSVRLWHCQDSWWSYGGHNVP